MALFNVLVDDELPILEVQGKLGMDTLPRFQKELEDLCAREGHVVVLDLMECPYMCSRTFPPLLHMSERLNCENRKLLIACSAGLLEILGILRLDQKLNLFTRRSACLKEARRLL